MLGESQISLHTSAFSRRRRTPSRTLATWNCRALPQVALLTLATSPHEPTALMVVADALEAPRVASVPEDARRALRSSLHSPSTDPLWASLLDPRSSPSSKLASRPPELDALFPQSSGHARTTSMLDPRARQCHALPRNRKSPLHESVGDPCPRTVQCLRRGARASAASMEINTSTRLSPCRTAARHSRLQRLHPRAQASPLTNSSPFCPPQGHASLEPCVACRVSASR